MAESRGGPVDFPRRRTDDRDMSTLTKTSPKIGLFSIGLAAYWPQFPELKERLAGYGKFVGERLSALGASVIDVGMVDDQPSAAAAGERFIREDVDMIMCYVTTYATSSQVLPA